MRINQVIVAKDFPIRAGEILRIRYPGSRKETRVLVGTADNNGNHVARSWSHDVGTNKESISLVGNERKLRRV